MVDCGNRTIECGNHPLHDVFRMIKSSENWPADVLGLNACVNVHGCFNKHKRGMTGVGRICAICVDMKNHVYYYAISFENEDAVSYVHIANATMVPPLGTASAPPKASTAAPAPAAAPAPTTPSKKRHTSSCSYPLCICLCLSPESPRCQAVTRRYLLLRIKANTPEGAND